MREIKTLCLAAVLFMLAGLSGCGQFFPPIAPPCTTNCTTTNNFLYVANTISTTPSVAGFSITGTTAAPSLNVTPNSAYSTAAIPSALAITPNNKFLYVGALSGGIFLYTINSDGSITLQNNSTAVATGISPVTMRVDSTGAWLIVTNASLSTSQPTMVVYSIASNTGLLTLAGKALTLAVPGSTSRMTIAPNNSNVYVTLGTGGVEILGFNASTGVLSDIANQPTKGNPRADQGVAVGLKSTYLFVTETGGTGLRVFSILSAKPYLMEVAGSPFATGVGPSAVMVDTSGSYVYVANSTDSTVSGYILAANGTVTQISGSPFTSGTTPVDMVEDNSKSYVGVVSSGGNPDLELFKFDATTGGKLDSVATATTGTDPTSPFAIAATH